MSKPPVEQDQSLDVMSPFTKGEFRDARLDERRLRTSEFRSVFYGVYVHRVVPDSTLVRARAALKIAGPKAHASHHTAAEIHELCPPRDPHTHVSTPSDVSRPEVSGIAAHTRPRHCGVVTKHGIRVSNPVQTFLDLAAHPSVGLVDLVVVGDRLVRKRLTTPARLIEVADKTRGRGCRLARRAGRFVRDGVDSPMETRLRMLIVLAGLPEPRVNLIMRWPDGDWRVRIDLYYPPYKVMVEYDGRQHADVRQHWLDDIKRRDQLVSWGWRIVIVTAEGIYDDPEGTLLRIVSALRERHVPGVPRKLSREWRNHFVPRSRG